MPNTPLPSSFDNNADFYEENRWQKFSRRLKEEPLIPLGCALTCWALLGASRSIRAGDHNRTNRMFRARIYAQGFTLLAMIAGSVYWQGDRNKRKEFEGVIAEKKAKEKNEAWIRELEARDEEEKEMRLAREARRAGIKIKNTVVEEKDKVEKKAKDVINSLTGDGKGAASMIGEGDKKESILQSVRDLVWGRKK